MPKPSISLAHIERLRAHRWRTARARQITDEPGALRFISELGFLLLMPIAGAELPSIHTATRRQWAWWDWKQTLPGRKACYYAKVLRRRGTFIAWSCFPHFYAAYARRRPYSHQFRDGLLDREEKQILDLLSERGPLMTTDLRLAFAPRSKQNTRRLKALLTELQRRFLICAAGGDTQGWSHHRWDLVERWVPSRLFARARELSPRQARASLVRSFISNMLVTTPADITWVFGWDRATLDPVLDHLLSERRLQWASVPEVEADVLLPNPSPFRGRRRRSGAR
jgi:hypothetical protein